MSFLEELNVIRTYAEYQHGLENQRYGEYPYIKHLNDVCAVTLEFHVMDEDIVKASLLHDVIEDTGATYDVIKSRYGERIARLVDAVTDPEGLSTRKQRKAAVYEKINACDGAVTIKLADRIANVRSCWAVATADKLNKSRLGMYRKEYGAFRKALRNESKATVPDLLMWTELDRLLAWKN